MSARIGMLGAIVVVLAATTLPASAMAQVSVKATGSAALARAIQLHDSAVALYDQPKRSAEAARLHLREVEFRTPGDPEAVQSLIMAANLLSYARQPLAARRIMERAAERALAMGDVVGAAHAYTNAAFLAHSAGNSSELRRLGRKAIVLGESPLLEPAQRASIRNRFRVSPKFAALLH